MFVIISILQALAAMFTIFGALHAPNVVDTVVTYGASGPASPNMAMYANSIGSIVLGVGSWSLSLLLKSKFGLTSPLALAFFTYMRNTSDKVAQFQLFMAVVDLIEKHLTTAGDPNDAQWIEQIRKFITERFVSQAITK